MKRLRFAHTAAVALFLVVACCTGAPAEPNTGAENLMIGAEAKGAVSFPHHRHQETLSGNCQACHALFPQTAGSIARLKQEGTLAPKQVMNGLCINCHRETAAAGKPSGPRSCTICHAGE